MHTGADTASPTLTPSSSDPVGDRAARAVFVAFFGSGVAFASWASPHPAGPRRAGAVTRAAWAWCCWRSRSARVDRRCRVAASSSPARRRAHRRRDVGRSARRLAPSAVGHQHGVAAGGPGLFLLGFGNGTWDVAMNVEGAAVEQRLGRSIMSRFHAGFSVGTVAGAAARGRRWSRSTSRVTAHLVAVAAGRRGRPAARGARLPARAHARARGERRAPQPADGMDRAAHAADRAVRVRAAFTEGTGNDWLGVAVIDGYDARRRARLADVRALRRRDDRRPLVRPRAARPLRSACRVLRVLGPRRAAGSSLVVFGAGRCRWPWPAPCCGASAPRSASRSG